MNSYHILSFFLTLLKVKYTSVLKKTVGNYLSGYFIWVFKFVEEI